MIADASGVGPVTTDLGYVVEVTEARIAVEDLLFAVAGEAHATSLWGRVSRWVVPVALAHPGHFQGSEVTGELLGRFVLDYPAGHDLELGRATLFTGTYTAASFTFARGSAESGLLAADPLFGHTARIVGIATREGEAVAFEIVVDSPLGRELTGAPFAASVGAEATGRLKLRFLLLDPVEHDTVFDGIDFAALDTDGDGQVRIAPDVGGVGALAEAYNLFRRTFQTHDHFDVLYEP